MIILGYFVLFLLYFVFQIRGIYGGDSAEYSLVAKTWSIPHPPGYPLYSFLLNLARIFFPTIPDHFRNNFFSIIPSIFTGMVIYLILKELKINKIIALLAGMFYLSLFPVWLNGEIPEVFALNSLFLSLIIFFSIRFYQTNDRKFKFFLYFTTGLSLTHHHTIIFIIPGIFLFFKKKLKSLIKEDFLMNSLSFLAGLLPYLYAPIASLFNPPIDWENSKTVMGLIRLVTRSSYGTFKAYTTSVPNIINQFTGLLSIMLLIIQDFKPVGIILIFLGFIYFYNKNRNFFRLITLSLLLYLIFLFITNFNLQYTFSIGTFERFLIMFYLMLVLTMAGGMNLIYDYIINNKFIIKTLSKKFVAAVFLGYLIIYLILSYRSSLNKIKYLSKINVFDGIAKNLLNTPSKNSIILLKGDLTYFPAAYYYYGLNYRSDLKLIFPGMFGRDYYVSTLEKKYPNLFLVENNNSNAFSYAEFYENNYKKMNILSERADNLGYWVPYGLYWKYYNNTQSIDGDLKNIVVQNDNFWLKTYRIPKLSSEESNIFFVKSLQEYYLEKLQSYVYFLIDKKYFIKAVNYLALMKNHQSPSSLIDGVFGYISKNNYCSDIKKSIYSTNQTSLMSYYDKSCK